MTNAFQPTVPCQVLLGTLVILTGASRGLGHAMASQLLCAGATVLGLSRTGADDLRVMAAKHGGEIVQWPVDLANPELVCKRLTAFLVARERDGSGLPQRVRLIHNAALMSTPGAIGQPDVGGGVDAPIAELVRSLRVGLEAPVTLTAAFLRATAGWVCDRRVLFISSGLGRRAMAGTAAYCAQKAGLDHFARALALEEATRSNGARICSLAPGVIDTGMQLQLRTAAAARFPERAVFEDLHRGGGLDTPAAAAAKVLAILEHIDFGAQPVSDVRV